MPALRRRTHVSAFALVVYWHDPDGTPIAAYQVPGLHRVEVQRPIFEALNQDIINIYSYKYVKELLKCIINILLKYTGTVFYTK